MGRLPGGCENGPAGRAGDAPPPAPATADNALRDALESLESPAAHARVAVGRLVAAAAAAAAVASEAAGRGRVPMAGGCRRVLEHLEHDSEEVRAAACAALPPLLRLLDGDQPKAPPAAGDDQATRPDGEASVAREAFVALLAQLPSTSPALRGAALAALGELPRWDPQAFARSVKIPGFQKVADGPDAAALCDAASSSTAGAGTEQREAGAVSKEPAPERWHGALYFALDDEVAALRAATLRLLARAVSRQELEYTELLKGVFQRMAALGTLCLADDAGPAREAAAELMESILGAKSIKLMMPKPSEKLTPDMVQVGSVVRALRVDRDVALRVLRAGSFEEGRALEAAVAGLLDVEAAGEATEAKLRGVLSRIGDRHAEMLRPVTACCINRRPNAGKCRGLAHRLLASAVGPGASEAQTLAAMSAGSSLRLDRLQELFRAAAGVSPELWTCLPGLKADSLGAKPPISDVTPDSLACWARHLGDCCVQLREVALSPQRWRVMPKGVLPGRGARRGLRYLQRVCASAARDWSQRGPHALAPNLTAVAAWAELLCFASEACAAVDSAEPLPPAGGAREGGGDLLQMLAEELGTAPGSACRPPPLSAGALAAHGCRLHTATSRLMHGFAWGATPGRFPQALLAFRLLSLRLLAESDGSYGEDLAAAWRELRPPGQGDADLAGKTLGCFLPPLSAEYFAALLGPSATVRERTGRITWAGGGPPSSSRPAVMAAAAGKPVRFPAALGGRLLAEVDVTDAPTFGLLLRGAYPCAGPEGEQLSDAVHVPLPKAAPGAEDLRTCELPLRFPWPTGEAVLPLRLQLKIRTPDTSEWFNLTNRVACLRCRF